jgi:glycosyltransferase involved in cell wall biosynthesis
MKQVVIVQQAVKHFREPFFELLRSSLRHDYIDLNLIAGQPPSWEGSKNDTTTVSWASMISNRYIRIGRRYLVWQPIRKHIGHADLVIVEQGSRLLANYALLLRRPFGGPKIAFWGHGVNHDREHASRLGEAIKRFVSRRADWWFCYTEGTARITESLGVDPQRMTVVQNAIDTDLLCSLRASVSELDLRTTRNDLGISAGPVAVVLGSIYPSKRPGFVVAAADALRSGFPDFHLIVIGDGPDRTVYKSAAETRPWLHFLGMRTGGDLARYSAVADVLLNPGLVGLTVLDSFALRLPMVTCAVSYHSPEIEYLVSGVNGLLLRANVDPQEYADAVAEVVRDTAVLERLRHGCADSAARYSITEMVERFRGGILQALQVA